MNITKRHETWTGWFLEHRSDEAAEGRNASRVRQGAASKQRCLACEKTQCRWAKRICRGPVGTLGATPANQCGPEEPEPNEAALRDDAEYAAWIDARVEAVIAMQDDAEWQARRFGPEPEFMLAVGMDDGR